MPNSESTANRPGVSIVTKPWNYCNGLRDDGMLYGDCVEQLTCLLTKSGSALLQFLAG